MGKYMIDFKFNLKNILNDTEIQEIKNYVQVN